jgi:hypothetical protein
MDAEPSTSEPAPKPKFTGPMDKYLSDQRVEAAVNRAVKSITDNPADLERELRAFKVRPDLGGLAAEEHDAGAGERGHPKEAGQGDEGTREGQEGGRTRDRQL